MNSPVSSSKDSNRSWIKKAIGYDPKVLEELINKHFPDWRRVLNEIQRYSVGGKIDSGILASFSDVKTNDLFKRLKEKDFPAVRKWVVDNLDNDPTVLLRSVYDEIYSHLDGPGILCCTHYREIPISEWIRVDQEINMF